MEFDLDKYKKKKSSRHHYIPQFLIKGFTNSNGVVYVYDKLYGEILRNPKPPRAIFFERDRNTVNLPDDNQSSLLEDVLYKEIDEIGSKVVKYFQNTELSQIDFSNENIGHFLFFLVTLFWRIPLTDFSVDDIVDRSGIESKGIESDVLRNDKAFRKSQRGGIMIHTINEMMKNSDSCRKSIAVHQISEDILVLGDNPLLFRRISNKFSDFGKEDFLIALSSNRIYSSTKESINTLSNLKAYEYNVAIINQSSRYVCCSNLEHLKKSIKVYDELCKQGLNNHIIERPFLSTKLNKTAPNK